MSAQPQNYPEAEQQLLNSNCLSAPAAESLSRTTTESILWMFHQKLLKGKLLTVYRQDLEDVLNTYMTVILVVGVVGVLRSEPIS